MVRLAERVEIVDLSPEEMAKVEAALVEGEDRSSLIRMAIDKELRARARRAVRRRRAASATETVQARLISTGQPRNGQRKPVVLVETRTGRGWKLHYDRKFLSQAEAKAWILDQGYELVDALAPAVAK